MSLRAPRNTLLVFLFAIVPSVLASTLSQNPIEQIQYVGAVACKELGCKPQTASLIGVAVFHQECGARPNCNGHAPAYRGSFALSEEQFSKGIASYLPIAQRQDAVLREVLQSEIRRTGTGGTGRESHILSAAAWFGNNSRFLNPIERVTTDPYRQAAIGMMLQLMPTQTHRALLSADPASLLNVRLSCEGNGAVWALNKNSVPVTCGSTGADAINLMVQGYQTLRRGVSVALGSAPPMPGSLASAFTKQGLGTITSPVFNQDGSFAVNNYQSGIGGLVRPAAWDTAGVGEWSQQRQTVPSSQDGSGQQSAQYGGQQTAMNGNSASPQYQYSSNPNQQNPYSSMYQSPQTQSQRAETTYADSQDAVATDVGSATIDCSTESVSWTCYKSSQSRAVSSPNDSVFSTRGYLNGSSRVSPSVTTTYTVQCLRNQQIIDQASCTIVAKRGFTPTRKKTERLELTLEPSTIRRGQSVHLEWSGHFVERCTVRAPGLNEEGIEGSIDTQPVALKGTHTFTLSCVTQSGEKTQKTASLIVL